MSTRAQVLLPAAVPVVMDKIAGIDQTALEGIRRGMRKLHEAAHELATAPARGTEPMEQWCDAGQSGDAFRRRLHARYR
jgi:hypothetical protein